MTNKQNSAEGINIELPKNQMERYLIIKNMKKQIKFFELMLENNIKADPEMAIQGANPDPSQQIIRFQAINLVMTITSLTPESEARYQTILDQAKKTLENYENGSK